MRQNDFAKSVHISQSHLSGIMSPNLRRKPSKRLLRSISEKYSVNYEWLLSGKGEPQSSEKIKQESQDPPELQHVIAELRTIWYGLDLARKRDLAGLLKVIIRFHGHQTAKNLGWRHLI
jgi:transcriptional regulator with XRE-family HTH domain